MIHKNYRCVIMKLSHSKNLKYVVQHSPTIKKWGHPVQTHQPNRAHIVAVITLARCLGAFLNKNRPLLELQLFREEVI